MKRIVVDAGPLIHLHAAGGLALLSKTGEVFAPQIIAAEAKSLPAIPEWLNIREPSPNSYNELQPWVAVGVLEGGEAARSRLRSSYRLNGSSLMTRRHDWWQPSLGWKRMVRSAWSCGPLAKDLFSGKKLLVYLMQSNWVHFGYHPACEAKRDVRWNRFGAYTTARKRVCGPH